MTTPHLDHLAGLMADYNMAKGVRAAREEDPPQDYNDACDVEDEARTALMEAAINALPALIAIAKAAQDIIAKRDLHWANIIEHRIARELALVSALARLHPATETAK